MLELPRLYSENNLKNKQHNIIVMLLILFNTHVSRVGCEESPFDSLPVASIIYRPKVILMTPIFLGGMNRNNCSSFLI